jgi:hypothetical protein
MFVLCQEQEQEQEQGEMPTTELLLMIQNTEINSSDPDVRCLNGRILSSALFPFPDETKS